MVTDLLTSEVALSHLRSVTERQPSVQVEISQVIVASVHLHLLSKVSL